jgi:hypothetical protein
MARLDAITSRQKWRGKSGRPMADAIAEVSTIHTNSTFGTSVLSGSGDPAHTAEQLVGSAATAAAAVIEKNASIVWVVRSIVCECFAVCNIFILFIGKQQREERASCTTLSL